MFNTATITESGTYALTGPDDTIITILEVINGTAYSAVGGFGESNPASDLDRLSPESFAARFLMPNKGHHKDNDARRAAFERIAAAYRLTDNNYYVRSGMGKPPLADRWMPC